MMSNGKASAQAEKRFGGGLQSGGYVPTVLMLDHLYQNQGKVFTWRDVEQMRWDDTLQFGISILSAPIRAAQWTVNCQDQNVANYIDAQYKRIWQHDLDKILTAYFEYGTAAGEVAYRDLDGFWEVDGLHDRHLTDVRAKVSEKRQIHHLEIKGVPKKSGPVELYTPRWWWIARKPRFGAVYGQSRIKGAWEAWQEKSGLKGAKEVRRMYFFKHAFTGGKFWVPIGTLETPDGRIRSCEEYGREILEKMETGGCLVLPNTTDEAGKRQWDHEPAEVGQPITNILDYVTMLNDEILTSMGIPVEIVRAASSGSGWSGRSVPLRNFLTSLDSDVDAIVQMIDRQIVKHLVRANFGQVRYEVVPVSLLKQAEDQPGAAQPGQPGQPGEGDPMQQGQPPGQPPTQDPNAAAGQPPPQPPGGMNPNNLIRTQT